MSNIGCGGVVEKGGLIDLQRPKFPNNEQRTCYWKDADFYKDEGSSAGKGEGDGKYFWQSHRCLDLEGQPVDKPTYDDAGFVGTQ